MSMKLKMLGRVYPVADYAEASAIYCRARDASGQGQSTFRSAAIYVRDAQVAYVAYNGRVFAGTAQAWTSATPLLFDSRLFNCRTGSAPPDWSWFCSLEVGGCISETDDAGTVVTGGQPDDTAEFWTVYARRSDGCAEAITDCKTKPEASAALAELAALSGLPVLS